jgi:rhodanese-related sulfurtransferase
MSYRLVAALLIALTSACSNDHAPPSPAAESAASLPDHDPALAHKLVAGGGLLIDVRSKEEFSGKHVEGAVNIPVNELESRLAEVEKLSGGDKKKPIVVYCQMGGRAAQAKKLLAKNGYQQVTNLGGVDDWDKK